MENSDELGQLQRTVRQQEILITDIQRQMESKEEYLKEIYGEKETARRDLADKVEECLEAKRCLNATNATVEQLEAERDEKERKIIHLEAVRPRVGSFLNI